MNTIIITIYLSCMPALFSHDALIALKSIEVQEWKMDTVKQIRDATKDIGTLPEQCTIRYATRPKR